MGNDRDCCDQPADWSAVSCEKRKTAVRLSAFCNADLYGGDFRTAAAGNDIIMPGNRQDDADIRQAYAEGKLSEREIRACAGRVIRLAEKLSEKEER